MKEEPVTARSFQQWEDKQRRLDWAMSAGMNASQIVKRIGGSRGEQPRVEASPVGAASVNRVWQRCNEPAAIAEPV